MFELKCFLQDDVFEYKFLVGGVVLRGCRIKYGIEFISIDFVISFLFFGLLSCEVFLVYFFVVIIFLIFFLLYRVEIVSLDKFF